jgi:hypothetical protein
MKGAEMLTKADIEAAMKQAGMTVADELPGQRGGWFYSFAGMESSLFEGKADAVLAGLRAAEELKRLCKVFS